MLSKYGSFFRWELTIDSNASRKTESSRGVHGDYTRRITDSLNRGSLNYVERNDKCRSRSWYPLSISS
jgi:hypothetical protein